MRKPISVSELLAQSQSKLKHLKQGADAAGRTLAALQRALPAEQAGHVFGASLDEAGTLTVLVDSGAYATRLRYALPELLAALSGELGVVITRTLVRVRSR